MKVYYMYLLFINILAFIMYAIDKYLAVKHKYRISEKMLLTLSILGGMIGALGAMYAFRHKTKKFYFPLVNVLALIIHSFILLYLLGVL